MFCARDRLALVAGVFSTKAVVAFAAVFAARFGGIERVGLAYWRAKIEYRRDGCDAVVAVVPCDNDIDVGVCPWLPRS